MKVGILADLHMNLFRRFNPFFVHVEKAVDEFCRLCEERKVKLIVIPGDLFHTKWQLSTEALIKANVIVNKMADIAEVAIIRGNHDSASLTELDVNLCENYQSYPNVTVINNYRLMPLREGFLFHFLAYFDGKEAEDKVNSIQCDPKYKNVLFSHMAVGGFKMHENYDDEVAEIVPSRLNKFHKVFLGHFHGHQNDGHICYISSPLQSKHGDEHSRHGFVFYNTDDDEVEFIPNSFSPIFATMEMTKPNVMEALTLKNHYIRFIVKKHVSRDLLTSVRHKLLINNYDVEYKFDVKTDILEFASLQNWEDVKHDSLDEMFSRFLQQVQKPHNTTTEELLEAILS